MNKTCNDLLGSVWGVLQNTPFPNIQLYFKVHRDKICWKSLGSCRNLFSPQWKPDQSALLLILYFCISCELKLISETKCSPNLKVYDIPSCAANGRLLAFSFENQFIFFGVLSTRSLCAVMRTNNFNLGDRDLQNNYLYQYFTNCLAKYKTIIHVHKTCMKIVYW